MNDSLGPFSDERSWSAEFARYQTALRRVQALEPLFEDALPSPVDAPIDILARRAALLEALADYREEALRAREAEVLPLRVETTAPCLLGVDCPRCSGTKQRCGHLQGTWYVSGDGS